MSWLKGYNNKVGITQQNPEQIKQQCLGKWYYPLYVNTSNVMYSEPSWRRVSNYFPVVNETLGPPWVKEKGGIPFYLYCI